MGPGSGAGMASPTAQSHHPRPHHRPPAPVIAAPSLKWQRPLDAPSPAAAAESSRENALAMAALTKPGELMGALTAGHRLASFGDMRRWRIAAAPRPRSWRPRRRSAG